MIPLEADRDRVTPNGSVRVYATRDAGSSWNALANGLPQRDAYLTVLRLAFAGVGAGGSLQLYFGATSGEVFGSPDAGATWASVVTRLPPIYSLTASS